MKKMFIGISIICCFALNAGRFDFLQLSKVLASVWVGSSRHNLDFSLEEQNVLFNKSIKASDLYLDLVTENKTLLLARLLKGDTLLPVYPYLVMKKDVKWAFKNGYYDSAIVLYKHRQYMETRVRRANFDEEFEAIAQQIKSHLDKTSYSINNWETVKKEAYQSLVDRYRLRHTTGFGEDYSISLTRYEIHNEIAMAFANFKENVN